MQIGKTTITSKILPSYHQQEYSPSFQKMMSRAVSRIYKQRNHLHTINLTPLHSPTNPKGLTNITVSLAEMQGTSPHPVKVSSFFQVPIKESTGVQSQRRVPFKLEPIQSKLNEHCHQGKHPMLLNYKLQRYESLDRQVGKSVDDLISDIKIILKNKSIPRKQTIQTYNQDSTSDSRIKKCKLLTREKPKKSYSLMQPVQAQKVKTEVSNWSPWGTKEREED